MKLGSSARLAGQHKAETAAPDHRRPQRRAQPVHNSRARRDQEKDISANVSKSQSKNISGSHHRLQPAQKSGVRRAKKQAIPADESPPEAKANQQQAAAAMESQQQLLATLESQQQPVASLESQQQPLATLGSQQQPVTSIGSQQQPVAARAGQEKSAAGEVDHQQPNIIPQLSSLSSVCSIPLQTDPNSSKTMNSSSDIEGQTSDGSFTGQWLPAFQGASNQPVDSTGSVNDADATNEQNTVEIECSVQSLRWTEDSTTICKGASAEFEWGWDEMGRTLGIRMPKRSPGPTNPRNAPRGNLHNAFYMPKEPVQYTMAPGNQDESSGRSPIAEEQPERHERHVRGCGLARLFARSSGKQKYMSSSAVLERTSPKTQSLADVSRLWASRTWRMLRSI
jgi:hypothetical protein